MKEQLLDTAIEKLAADITGMLQEHKDQLREDFEAALTQHIAEGKDSEYKFPLTISVQLTPYGEQVKVKTNVGWGVKRKIEAEAIVDQHPELDFSGTDNQ